MNCRRRDFLKSLAAAVTLGGNPPRTGASEPLFTQLPPSKTGINWTHVSGRSPEKYLPETTGGGCAFLDYDNDGWMDIYLINSGRADFFTPTVPLRNALYRNNRNGTFSDVTEKAGLSGGGWGQGVAVGDYNGDGYPDIYLTQYGRSILYRNNGNGTFTDVTDQAKLAAVGWATSAVWFDYDNDGKLDLFVCRYVDFDKTKNKFCGDPNQGERSYCIPTMYAPMASWLFHNNGDGTFTDVSAASNIGAVRGKALGVVAADINNDGWTDLFVANDTAQNFLWMNRRGKFEETALQGGVAYSADGRPRSGMGVDAADFDQDGWIDLFVTNLDQEMYSLYRNNRDESFDDIALQTTIGRATRLMSGWGVKFFDVDNDGTPDLMIVNGHPNDVIDKLHSRVKYREPMMLFRQTPAGFVDVSADAGPAFATPLAARSLATGDYNNDGAIDVLVGVNDGPPLLLQNNAARGHHWLGVKLVGRKANPDAIGARLTWQAGDLTRTRQKVGGGSYLAAHDPREVLGLGARTRIDSLEIRWPLPSREVTRLTNLPLDQYVTIVEGATGVRG